MGDSPRANILIVEDDVGIATLQRRRLERAGFTAHVAADVNAAMTQLAATRVDLMLLDYRLGQTTGLDLHRRMKATGYDVPVIIVSGSMSDSMVIEAIRAGVRDVIVKSTDYLDHLPDAVRGVLDQTTLAAERQASEPARGVVLIVEDDEGIAALERKQLERSGYEVVVASNADEAMQVVQAQPVQLAILDLRLPRGTGIDLYERIKADGWTIPAILATAFADQQVAIQALRAGIRDFLPKSNQFLEYLPAAVDRVMSQARVERKLIESELRLASVIGTAMDAIVMCDEHLHVRLFNPSAEQMFGVSAEQAARRQLDAFIPGLELRQHGDGLAPGTVRHRAEVEAVRADDTRIPIEVSISDVVVHGRRMFTVIARDISERRRIEAELRDADRRKDEFLGMLAHELRNPLAAIMTAGEVLNRIVAEPSAGKMLAVVRRQTRALARMVDDLLDVSRVTLGKIQLAHEPLILGEVVQRAVEGQREAIAAAGLDLQVDIDAEPVWLRGDATRLEQVLTNLLNNAVKFTGVGGRIRVRAGRENGEAVIRVQDTGVGIERTLLRRVFDLFVQADTSLDRSKSGLGIGLALVRQLVTLHGGTVVAFSDGRGRGSEFVVRLPTAPEDTTVVDTEARVEAPLRALRIVIVDDQQDVADSLALLVRTMGHDATPVYGGAEALSILRGEAPDVMFVDLGMPGINGLEFARRVRDDRAFSGVTLVAVTGYGREDDRLRAHEAGFDLHVTKPLTESAVQGMLTKIAARRVAG